MIRGPQTEVERCALLINCDKCFCEPGEPCVSDDGTETVPLHEERVQEAKSLLEKGLRAYDNT